jgi:hypothetical protein
VASSSAWGVNSSFFNASQGLSFETDKPTASRTAALSSGNNIMSTVPNVAEKNEDSFQTGGYSTVTFASPVAMKTVEVGSK